MKRFLPIFFSLFLLPVTSVNLLGIAAPKTKIIAQAISSGLKNQLEQNAVTVTNANGTSDLGILLGKQDNNYLVLTSEALTQGNTVLTVKTSDGKTYQANLNLDVTETDTDFSLLEFSSNVDYVPAQLNPASQPNQAKQMFVVSMEQTGLDINRGQIGQAVDNSSELEQFNYSANTIQTNKNKAFFDDYGDLVGYSGGDTNSFTTLNSFLLRLKPEVTIAYNLKLPETAEQGTVELAGELKALEERAKKITVKIQSSSGATGSGVIVKRDGNTYTVLTSAHVVCESDPEDTNSDDCAENIYKVIAPNNESQAYKVEENSIKQANDDVDLARLEFKSSNDYEVATLANYAPVSSEGQSYQVVVSGGRQSSHSPNADQQINQEEDLLSSLKGITAPKLTSAASDTLTPDVRQETAQVNPLQKYFVFAAGYAQKSPKAGATWHFSPGYGLDQKTGSFNIYDRTSFDQGYQLVYTCITYGGMSGGPILDIEGRVVGIHGKTEGERIAKKNAEISLGYSLAIPIGEFNNIARSLAKDLDLDLGELNIKTERPSITDALRQNVADTILTTKVSKSNTDSCQWVERGNQQWRLLDYTAAEKSFRQAIDKQDAQCERLAWYGIGLSLIGSDFTNPTTSREAANNRRETYKQAAEAFHTASQSDRDFYAAIRRESIAWRAAGETQSALAAIYRAIEVDPDSSSLYNDKGALLAKLKRIDAAISAYYKAIDLEKTSHLPHYNLGLIFGYQEEWKKAIGEFEQAISNDDTYAPAYFNLGNVYYASGKNQEAQRSYEQAIQLEPKYAEAYHNLGHIYDRQEDYKAALEKYNQAIAIRSDYRRAYINRGRIYAIQGKWTKAKADYDEAINKLNDDRAETYLSRGLVLSELGDKRGAVEDIELAQKKFSTRKDQDGYEQATEFLQQIQQ